MLGSFLDVFVFNKLFFKKSFRNIIRVSNSLDPDEARHFVGWVRTVYKDLSADDKGRHLSNRSFSLS